MLIKNILLFTILLNICIVRKVFGVDFSERNEKHLKDRKVSPPYPPKSVSDSRITFDIYENNSRSTTVVHNNHEEKISGNVILNSLKPILRPHVAIGRNNRNVSDFNFGIWTILSKNRESPRQRRVKNISMKKCTRSDGERRPECLRKIKRRKILNEENNANAKRVHDNTFGAKDTSRVPGVSSVIEIDVPQPAEDDKPSILAQPHNDDKWSAKLGPNSCACSWRQEKCGCDCEGTLNYDDFQDISRSFFPCHNFTFTMADGEYYALPPNFFSKMKNVQYFNLFIKNSTFEYICDPTPLTSPFKGILFENSAQVKLTNVNVRRGWNWKPFEQLKSSSGAQVNVTLENCQLRRLASDFANLAGGHVDTIDIYNSELQMVGSNAFGTFENMTRFRIPSNKIRQLRRTDFPKLLFNLEEIDLRNNELSYLDNDLFTNMPSLKEIVISGNPISVLPEITFQAVIGKAELVGISDIPLTCDCRLQWLKNSVKHSNRTEKNMKGAVCRRPAYLRGMPFDFLSKEHLICY